MQSKSYKLAENITYGNSMFGPMFQQTVPIPATLTNFSINNPHDQREFDKLQNISAMTYKIDNICNQPNISYTSKAYGQHINGKLKYILQLRLKDADTPAKEYLNQNKNILLFDSVDNILSTANEFIRIHEIEGEIENIVFTREQQKQLSRDQRRKYRRLGWRWNRNNNGYCIWSKNGKYAKYRDCQKSLPPLQRAEMVSTGTANMENVLPPLQYAEHVETGIATVENGNLPPLQQATVVHDDSQEMFARVQRPLPSIPQNYAQQFIPRPQGANLNQGQQDQILRRRFAAQGCKGLTTEDMCNTYQDQCEWDNARNKCKDNDEWF